MIRIQRPAIATSIQDRGRFGHRAEGFCRSGAMDPACLSAANRLAGAAPGEAAIEFGPGPMSIEIVESGTLAFTGARRKGAPWWETLEVGPGDRFDLGSPADGMWSYLSIAGGCAAPLVLGSRSTSVREGIGEWLGAGSVVDVAGEPIEPLPTDQLAMTGPVRVFGQLAGTFRVGPRMDRMGYVLEGQKVPGGRANLTSEPLMPGCIQIPPGGNPIVLMAECPTVGGYKLGGVVHSEDLRLVAQRGPGMGVTFLAV